MGQADALFVQLWGLGEERAGLPLPLKPQRSAPGLTEDVRAGTEVRTMRTTESPWSALLSDPQHSLGLYSI